MITMQGWIRELMGLYEQDCPAEPCIPDEATQNLRVVLVQEEIDETTDAMKRRDMVETADGFADILVVTLGTHNAYGLESAFDYLGKMPASAPRFLDNEMMSGIIDNFIAQRNEFDDCIKGKEIHEIQAACDSIVKLVLDTSLALGIDILPVFMEVHWSNKTKFDKDGKPIKRESDGKVIKGPDYQRPDVASVLKRQEKYYIHTK